MDANVVTELKTFIGEKVESIVKVPLVAIEAKMNGIAEDVGAIKGELDTVKGEVETLKSKPVTSGDGISVGQDLAADRPWKNFGEQLVAVMQAGKANGHIDPRLMKLPTGAGEAISSDGGFLVQQDFATGLLQRTYQTGQVLPRVSRLGISANANGIKINAIDESSRATGSRWGGIQVYFVEEAGTVTATKPKFRVMELNLKKCMGLCYATDELLADTNALTQVISQGFASEFDFTLTDRIFNGTGAGCPLGILNSGAVVSVSKEAGQPGSTIVFENVNKMWARMWAGSWSNAVWFINQDCLTQLNQMAVSVGVGGLPVYMPPGGISVSPYSTLFGRPVIPIEQCQTLGTVGDIVLADLSQYLMCDKGGLQSAVSIHVQFLYAESVFRFIYRVDGQPIWNSALTPAHGSNTLSPFVTLATRA